MGPTRSRAVERLDDDAKGSLLTQVEAARVSGLIRSFNGQRKCPDRQVLLIIGDRVADNKGRLDWGLRPYWPGTPSRRLRATVDGREMTARLRYDGNEMTWSDGDVWKRIVPARRGGSPPATEISKKYVKI